MNTLVISRLPQAACGGPALDETRLDAARIIKDWLDK